jgi:glycine cleavage system aminomethyltransferase T
MNQLQNPTHELATTKRLRRLLEWAHEDLNDPDIRNHEDRLQQEREVTVARLAPHIEELVALALVALKAQNSEGSRRSAP